MELRMKYIFGGQSRVLRYRGLFSFLATYHQSSDIYCAKYKYECSNARRPLENVHNKSWLSSPLNRNRFGSCLKWDRSLSPSRPWTQPRSELYGFGPKLCAVAGTYTQMGSSPTTQLPKLAKERAKTRTLQSREFESLPGYHSQVVIYTVLGGGTGVSVSSCLSFCLRLITVMRSHSVLAQN